MSGRIKLAPILEKRCSEALSYGMPYELYWHGPLNAFWKYRDKFIIENKRLADERNATAWLNGLYILNAISAVLPKGRKYPNEPIKLDDSKSNNVSEAADRFRAYVSAKNELIKKQLIDSQKEGGEQNGNGKYAE